MIYDGKPFLRRPWERGDAGLIKHFDGIEIKNIKDQKAAFYICMHTGVELLAQNHVSCDSPQGWIWPKLIIENFNISNCALGIYITDAPDDCEIIIQNGNYSGQGPFLHIHDIRALTLTISRISQNQIIKITNSSIKKLRIIDCHSLDLKLELSNIDYAESVNSSKITGIKLQELKTQNIGSLALNLLINGRYYKGSIANLAISEK